MKNNNLTSTVLGFLRWARFYKIVAKLTTMPLYNIPLSPRISSELIEDYQRLRKGAVKILPREDIDSWDKIMSNITSSTLKLNYCPVR